ncbi:FkbM family methyltransferase [Acinetobacter lwoffii]|uniref:FkbM family methyltransferase n=1 Tax=Acinetobacter lwoffii TaxID=28090 RepID=UPI003F8D13B4
MLKWLDSCIKKILEKLGIKLMRISKYNERVGVYEELSKRQEYYLKLLFSLSGNNENVDRLQSQFGQDLFILYKTKFKRNGFFVEFGATDGKSISNTYILEKDYGWTGILAEPAKTWHPQLKKNRAVIIDHRCVWSHSKEKIQFNETDIKELSTIDYFSALDMHSKMRVNGNCYDVETISLIDLLREYNAPKKIDYLSIDTEGSEYEILKNFDFKEYHIDLITVEHNFTEMRGNILNLLTSKGYVRVFVEYSDVDDWYVHESFLV